MQTINIAAAHAGRRSSPQNGLAIERPSPLRLQGPNPAKPEPKPKDRQAIEPDHNCPFIFKGGCIGTDEVLPGPLWITASCFPTGWLQRFCNKSKHGQNSVWARSTRKRGRGQTTCPSSEFSGKWSSARISNPLKSLNPATWGPVDADLGCISEFSAYTLRRVASAD